MAKNMEVPLLYDYYGDMLTDKQRDMIEQYYHQDLSLSEIAENAGISRQGVRDSVKRAELQLFEMESRLGLVAKMKSVNASLEAISRYADAVYQHAIDIDNQDIKDNIGHVMLLVEKLQTTIV